MEESLELGPFAIGEQIGKGGMGSVYRGRHRSTDIPVALKVVGGLTTQKERKRFHAEVQAQARLLHPGIVYLFEYGTIGAEVAEASDGAFRPANPFVAMELADRGTVRDLLPLESWRDLRSLLVQILDAVAHAHARGVVHRDLKPENILAFETGPSEPGDCRLKLADFGIAHAIGGEHGADTSELQAPSGTPAYMAPEQLHGDWRQYGPWTDLYAVGCVAWELACGRRPFEGDPVSVAIKQQEADRPELDPRFPVPDELSGWIRRAMAVDPKRRFRRAADAACLLPPLLDESEAPDPSATAESGELRAHRQPAGHTAPLWQPQAPTLTSTGLGEDSTLARADTLPQQAFASEVRAGGDAPIEGALSPRKPPFPEDWRPEQRLLPAPLIGAGKGLFGLREPPFVNRVAECDQIWERLHRVVESGGLEVAFIRGDAGTGKTRLADWITTRAHEVGQATVVEVTHSDRVSPSDGVSGAIARTFRTAKLDRREVYEQLVDELSTGGEDPERLEQDARALTELLRPSDPDGEGVAGPRYRFHSPAQRRALIARVLDRLAADRPIVLWVDDLQWGSEALRILEDLCEMPDLPDLLVLATLRSDLLAEQPEIAERLAAVEQKVSAASITLEPLSRDHQRELLDGLVPLEEELAAQLAERTEGHPLFAMQLLGHWIESEDLEVGEDGFRIPDSRQLELPEDIHEVWMERVDRLLDLFPAGRGPEVLQALELAAALGREVDDEEWRAVLADADSEPPVGLVDGLVERGLAERKTGGWVFAHRLVVESLARRARQTGRWRDHHRRCAEVLAREVGEVPGPRERVAEHWEKAGKPERALAPLLAEIRLARQREDHDLAYRLLDRRARLLDGLDLPADHPRHLEQKLYRGQIERLTSHLQPADALFREVWEALGPNQPRLKAETALSLSRVCRQGTAREEMSGWANRALTISRSLGDGRLQCQCHSELAWIAFFDGELETAIHHAERACDLAREAGEHYDMVNAQRALAFARLSGGDPGAAELFEEVRQQADASGYVLLEAQALNGLGEAARFDGRFDEAVAYYRDYQQKMAELSIPVAVGNAEFNLAQVESRRGDFEALADHLEAAVERLEEVGGLEGYRELICVLEMSLAAGRGDSEAFDAAGEPLSGGWPEEWQLVSDHTWVLESVGEHALEAGWTDRARRIWSLAATLWRRLDDPEAAAELDARLRRLSEDGSLIKS